MAEDTWRMVQVDPAAPEVEVVYGPLAEQGARRGIPVLTRSLLNVLDAIAAEIDLPDAEPRASRALPTQREGAAPPPLITIRSGSSPPPRTHAAVAVAGTWHWVEDKDFRSKLTFTILELRKNLAGSGRGITPPVLTIPAG
jgi:hypothetical protein